MKTSPRTQQKRQPPASARRTPGKTRAFLETRHYAQGVKTRLPVLTVTGARPGPLAVVLSAQHGRELNGIPAIARVFADLDPAALAGTVVFLPVMNPLGVRMRRQDFPVEEPRYRPTGIAQALYNINRKWQPRPTAEAATYASEIAEAVWEAYWRHADVSLDLHGWTGQSLSLAWAQKRSRALLRAYGFPWHMVLDKPPATPGMSETAAFTAGIPHIVTELSPQNVLDPEMVCQVSGCIRNLLIVAGLLRGEPELPPVQVEFAEQHEEIVMATPVEGLLVPACRRGDMVQKGDTVVRVLSLETLAPLWEYRAPHAALVFNMGGVIWGEDYQDSAVVHPGQIVGLLKKPTRILRHR